MIISASRRTDIPAFYSEWFINRIKAGYVDVMNPFNRKQVSRISLKPQDVDCIVFWTKDAAPMIDKLDKLSQYKYYFQFTITPYDEDVEPGLLSNQSKQDIIKTFQKLSEKIGKDKVIWRYDPILLSENIHTIDWHFDKFSEFLNQLAPYTNRCIISFLDFYKKTAFNMRSVGIISMSESDMRETAHGFSQIAENTGIEIQSCSEKIDLSQFGIKHGACIDKEVIEKVISAKIDVKKDDTQRPECGCVKGVDIGQYDSCPHLCKYCYANFRPQAALTNYQLHDNKSSLLFGEFKGDENITTRKVEHLKIQNNEQLSLF